MSMDLVPLDFPLNGARLIEASAGTGKTWTIAALYVRLVLGHGGGAAFSRPLLPAEILVMTFTRAATRELSDRVRERLVEAGRCFRGQPPHENDGFLQALIADYPDEQARQRAAHRLMLAAEAMDEAAIFTIDAWCQRMLREHAFDSGCLFDEELVSSEHDLYRDAVRDYWRNQVYPLGEDGLQSIQPCWPDLSALDGSVRVLVTRSGLLGSVPDEPLAGLLPRVEAEQRECATSLKRDWPERIVRMKEWIAQNRTSLSGTKMRPATVAGFFEALDLWCGNPDRIHPGDGFDKGWARMLPEALAAACNNGKSVTPSADFHEVQALRDVLDAIEPLRHHLVRHAATTIARRMQELKQRSRQFGFADMLSRLKTALEGANGPALKRRILDQYPVALIDEFQDTSPDQYRIFDLLYRVADEQSGNGLFLIGDPKQAIYGFRGADIHSYLAARRATEGKHYRLGTNFRSTHGVVAAANRLFLHAEGEGKGAGHPAGAFRFRREQRNPLPFEAVAANGRKERLVCGSGDVAAMTIWCNQGGELKADSYRAHFAAMCAERILTLLNDPAAGFDEEGEFTRLKPADIAILVRDRFEADAVRRALQQRRIPSVYLSDKDSVFQSEQAADMLRWLHAVANPLDGGLARAAFATTTVGLSLHALAVLASDDVAWDACVEQLKNLRQAWQRQGVLAMLRQFIHELNLPATLLQQPDGERRLTNLLHLAELLQGASLQLDGEQALIRWLAEQIENDSRADDERVLRLESDAELVKVVTVYKSKGLEYPLVFLPFAVSAKKVEKRRLSFCEFTDDSGTRRIDLSMSGDSLEAMDRARIEEELRLLYVALTRARHALWLGVTSLGNKIHECAFGYLMAGGAPVQSGDLTQQLADMCGECADISVEAADEAPGRGRLARRDDGPALVDAPRFDAEFERDWSVASYTSITRELGAAPVTATEEKLLEDDDNLPVHSRQDIPWHRFPRGARPGQFLHEQLEWMANEGFAVVHDARFDERLEARCERAGWTRHREDTGAWMRAAATVALPPFDAALCDLQTLIPEMEFWIPAARLRTHEFDLLCQRHLFPGLARPALRERELQGMLRGFMDLVFEHEGRYWVLDYKSNALGPGDAAYHRQALENAVAANRYDVQGMIYLLALHRLLKSRMGDAYEPSEHLGGAVFFFLRGLGHPETKGCCRLSPDAALLDALDRLLPAPLESGVFA